VGRVLRDGPNGCIVLIRNEISNFPGISSFHRIDAVVFAERTRAAGIRLHAAAEMVSRRQVRNVHTFAGGNWQRYLDFMNAQLTELLSNYGPIGGIWFDG
jgi:hypothetical protein